MSAMLRLFSIFEKDLHHFQELFNLLFKFDMSIILSVMLLARQDFCVQKLRQLKCGRHNVVETIKNSILLL